MLRMPVVTVHENKTVDINLGEGTLKADDHHVLTTGKTIGYWSTSTPGITFGASIKERPAYPPRIEVVIIQYDAKENWCGVKWVGIGDKF